MDEMTITIAGVLLLTALLLQRRRRIILLEHWRALSSLPPVARLHTYNSRTRAQVLALTQLLLPRHRLAQRSRQRLL